MCNEEIFNIDLIDVRNKLFTDELIVKSKLNIEIDNNTIANRRKLNSSNLLSILKEVNLSYKSIISLLIDDKLFSSLINNVGLNLGCYTMFLTSVSLFLEYFNELIYPKNDTELYEVFCSFYKAQPKIKTMLSRKVEYNKKDILFNNFLKVAKYMDETLDKNFEQLSELYIIETYNYTNWTDNIFKFSNHHTNVFSDKLFKNIDVESKKTVFELQMYDFQNLSATESLKIKKLLHDLSNIRDVKLYITPVKLTQTQKNSILKLFEYIKKLKGNNEFSYKLIDVEHKDDINVEVLMVLKIFYKNAIYTIRLEQRKFLLFLTLMPTIYGVYRISYHDISDFQNLLSEVTIDYQIRSRHIKDGLCWI